MSNTGSPDSGRRALRDTLKAVIEREQNHPWGMALPGRLADVLMVIVRRAQHDAWTRGYAAAMLEACTGQDHQSPYKGGRHASNNKYPYPYGYLLKTPFDNNTVAVRLTDPERPPTISSPSWWGQPGTPKDDW